ncbi:serine hydrolase [Nonomuraea rosea]|uniref:Serine hydrolase n=1 Tax=Nonomuraea rosea TaxID=638574 RepID=A0ABP6WI25_9ACTN
MNTPSKPVRILAAAAVAVTMSACAGQPAPVQATASAVSSAPEIPGTPAGAQLRWLLDALSRPPVAETELSAHFAAGFLKSIPAAQLNQVFATFKGMRLEEVVTSQHTALLALGRTGGTAMEIALSVDGTGLINGLRFQPPAAKSWAELDQRLGKTASRTSFLAAEVTKGGDCRPAHAVAAGKAQPLGSMFKLYVLGAVAERIKSGAFGWDTQLTITPELKSLPGGQLQDRPDGSKVSVLEAAKMMISISDNTATDLLIHKAGRKAVERTMRVWGNDDKRNVPFLTTRELFVLKGAEYPRHAKRYLPMNVRERRAYLDGVVAKVPLSSIAPWTAPRELDTLEWFGSPADVCEAYAGLAKLRDKRVGEALSINDAGLGLDGGEWPVVWYKGGSELGLVDMSFLARTAKGRTYVVTSMSVDPGAPIGEQATMELVALARGAFTLVKSS